MPSATAISACPTVSSSIAGTAAADKNVQRFTGGYRNHRISISATAAGSAIGSICAAAAAASTPGLDRNLVAACGNFKCR